MKIYKRVYVEEDVHRMLKTEASKCGVTLGQHLDNLASRKKKNKNDEYTFP